MNFATLTDALTYAMEKEKKANELYLLFRGKVKDEAARTLLEDLADQDLVPRVLEQPPDERLEGMTVRAQEQYGLLEGVLLGLGRREMGADAPVEFLGGHPVIQERPHRLQDGLGLLGGGPHLKDRGDGLGRIELLHLTGAFDHSHIHL